MKWRNWTREFRYGGPLLDYYRFSRVFPTSSIRLYDESDFDACRELYKLNEAGRFPGGFLTCYEDHLREKKTRILVAEDDSQVVGTAGISIAQITDDCKIVWLSYGLVHPDFHGEGLGTLLLCARLAYLSAWQDWDVWITSAGNGTEKFYKNLGFDYVSTEVDENGTSLEYYRVKVIGQDVARFHALVSGSESASRLDFSEDLPSNDQREAYKVAHDAQQDAAPQIRPRW